MSLTPDERAAFATTARLLSCLVTESLIRAVFLPLKWPGGMGVGVVLNARASGVPVHECETYTPEDVLAIVALQDLPVFKHGSGDSHRVEIGLLDPLDMHPLVFLVTGDQGVHMNGQALYSDLSSAILETLSKPGWSFPETTTITKLDDPLVLWDKFARDINLDDALRSEISDELASSVQWQTYSYEHPPNAPTLTSPSIDWEQSIVEGHPTHPMHKTRHFLPPLAPLSPGRELYSPRVRLVALPRTSLRITGEFEALAKPVVEASAKNAGEEVAVPEDHVIVPVHELQVVHILDKFKEAIALPDAFSVPALAQQSIRSVILPDVLPTTHLKLAVGIKLTSAIRTISPASAYVGPRFSSQVVPVLRIDPSLLTVARELASAVHVDQDNDVAKHCAAIVRECHENGSEARGERLIVCTSLVERGHAGTDGVTPSVVRAFELDTEEKRIEWLNNFVRLFFAAFLPQVLENGVAFEAHPQNTVARFALAAPHELRGFVIRDFGGLRVHQPTLRASTGVTLDVVPGHSIIAETLDDVYTRTYHTMIHNHLQQLVRVLGLHYNGKGWGIVRMRLREAIPSGHALEKAWLGEESRTLPGKCFMRMRMVGMYRHVSFSLSSQQSLSDVADRKHLHGPFPNLLHYTGGKDEEGLMN
ncbi:IucC family-domain-containing protein [Gloeopeniophorella convolvens]|nr:IucC family-domain-containing protein [Gloeopeniophorella convolvens]